MQLRDILSNKGRTVLSIAPQATLADVVHKLVHHNCGSLVVCENDELIGIITERDILRASAQRDRPLESIQVETRMTRELVTATPDDEVEQIMGLMTKRRIRHMPVLEDGKLAGMISIGDLVKAHHDRLCLENEYLKNYISS
jgi:CBS domain-containing protein